MAKRMLIDTTHPEETRVVVLNGTRLEQFDVETSTKKQIKGNIYLAKVIRVEPSLQAAFVEYSGGRHGFLAFSEIHPDYYQIPVADRQALLAEEAARAAEEAERDSLDDQDMLDGPEDGADPVAVSRTRRVSHLPDYKIQEVVKRRQIMLVQVVKEERGNKGAALTTYLSLAGRYCVLMPNTAKGGGVSRKITNLADRKRLKEIMSDLDVPSQMAVILRTAGQERSRAEIKRDYEYLIRTWVHIRDTTMQSCAPALVHEEGNLIKRAIRDIYSTDIEEVLVEGEDGYRVAKDFMKILTPSHSRRVQSYRDPAMPLFHRFQVDSQLDAMHSPTVQLKSGGYVVINQTEALVAIDVNSGRATKERHIEETALKTNLEAAEEIARQLRLRDLAGLVVIDFIDMEDVRNNAAVERRLKDALRLDRARIQLGRISGFGLLELSRQRLRPSLMETSFQMCSHCAGTGMVRSVESAAVHILRVIEEEGVRRRASEIVVHVATPVALYVLNNKRSALADIEQRHALTAFLKGDDTLIAPECRIERLKPALPMPVGGRPLPPAPPLDLDEDEDDIPDLEPDADDSVVVPVAVPVAVLIPVAEELSATNPGSGDEAEGRKRRKRRRRRRRDDAASPVSSVSVGLSVSDDAAESSEHVVDDEQVESAFREEDGSEVEVPETAESKRRRRSRRGGRRRRRGSEQDVDTVGSGLSVAADNDDEAGLTVPQAMQDVPGHGGPDGLSGVFGLPRVEEELTARPPLRRVRRVRRDDGDDRGGDVMVADAPTLVLADAAVVIEPVALPSPVSVEDEAPVTPRARRSRKPSVSVDATDSVEAVGDTSGKPVRKRASRSRAAVASDTESSDVDSAGPVARKRRAPRKAGSVAVDDSSSAVVEVASSSSATSPELAMEDVRESTNDLAPRRGWWKR